MHCAGCRQSATHLASRLARRRSSFLSSSVAISRSVSFLASATASSSSVRTGSQRCLSVLKDLLLFIHIAQLITLRVFTNVTLPTLPANEGQAGTQPAAIMQHARKLTSRALEMEDDPILNFIVETRSMTLRNIDAVLEKRSEVVCQHAKLLREIDEGLSVLPTQRRC